jgi:membrane peptidoglycan carboxypeptidase
VLAVAAWAAYLSLFRLPPIELRYPLEASELAPGRCGDCAFVRELAARSSRIFTPLAALPPGVAEVFVEAEDARFHAHRGVDWAQLWRAARKDVASASYRYGASTITMQLVRTLLLPREKRLTRKVREMAYALALERRWDKARILEAYLNEVDFGRGLRGIGAAACYYFGAPATTLSPEQAVLLASILPSPDRRGAFAARSACAVMP